MADSPEPHYKHISELAARFSSKSMSVDFFCIGSNGRAAVADFATEVNGSTNCYKQKELDRLCYDVVCEFIAKRVIFGEISLVMSEPALSIEKVLSPRKMDPRKPLNIGKIGGGDAFHFVCRVNPKCLINSRIAFVIRYVDSMNKIWRRVIPINLASRQSSPEAFFAWAALRVATKEVDAATAFFELKLLDLSQFPPHLTSQIRFASSVLNIIHTSAFLSHYVLRNCASAILARMSPNCLEIGGDNVWKTPGDVRFGELPIIVLHPGHQLLCVIGDDVGCSDLDMLKDIAGQIDPKSIFEVLRFADLNENVRMSEIILMLNARMRLTVIHDRESSGAFL
jgi:hypothetical protein